ncbi:protein EURL homolog isoform X1 [Malaclemys terrapin pileata]|uniref:protein EURL homolog isoform X1 n=1 Tax=Chrysemys picta bellii TaxID=8478 RepID=UPI001C67F7B6|nr:protein EURL homolog isoform X1 [Chrysemys picta bellii]XP_042711669.1 protein EURL homolog isoform X1 [Chrysemys picta bellii]XP_042711670.1 protein EURL homolog isoform X1 [Chrysemys picta bellii]XP_053903400.1 protein EURL homolog isoform X1 [Malaclemys terrapin pileata]XP_053903409.1 protein EURL homolog isoform X1 [Malaclemys terrapin pileata]
MNEEQFVNIDLNDDNVCSVCKLGTEKETLSFCHVCFELNIEEVRPITDITSPTLSLQNKNRVPKSNLLHTRSLRGHRDCFEKFHLIANQDCPRSKLSKSTYAEVKSILSKKINRIIQYAQNKDLDSDSDSTKTSQHQLFNFRHQTDRKLLPQFDSQVPRYSAKWIDGSSGSISKCSQSILEQKESTDFRLDMLQETGATFCCKSVLWSSCNQAPKTEKAKSDSDANTQRQHPRYSRDELNMMTPEEVEQLNEKLLKQIQDVFEELTREVQEKDSLASELNVRHIAIEQLLKNCSKLPCLQVGRAGMKSNVPI